jgi:hypothetical protein
MLPTAALVLAMVSGAVAQCSTSTETVLAVATTLSDFSLFRASMDQIYSTVEDAFTGATVYVWTTLDDSPDAGTFTAYGVYDANALISAGYSITTEMAEVTVCETPAEETGALPPSPTGADCSPHGDHCTCIFQTFVFRPPNKHLYRALRRGRRDWSCKCGGYSN